MSSNHLSKLLFLFALLLSCSKKEGKHLSFGEQLNGTPHLSGKSAYLASPFVTAGDRVYMVGHQDGSFPPLGWHITGEMGGVWDHPIKLLDGFEASVTTAKGTYCLNQADRFVNHPAGNRHHFNWQDGSLEVDRTQFVPDGKEGVVIEFVIRNNDEAAQQVSFSFSANFDLRPTWLGDRTGMNDGKDKIRFLEKENVFIANDESNPWFTAVGSGTAPSGYSFERTACTVPEQGATLTYEKDVPPQGEVVISMCVAGSYHSMAEALSTFSDLAASSHSYLASKISRFDTLRNTARVEVPDTTLQGMLEWVKYSTDWLIREVPEIGRGLSAGSPDYPWWFGCDNEYALQGVLATGRPDLAKSTIQLLKKISDKTNGNGRIIHEASTNGAVYNPGNTNETAQFISLLWDYYRWTGDKAFVKQLYPDVIKGLGWLLEEKDPDRNLFPNGAGMVEIAGLDGEMIDVAVYTQQALEAAGKLAAVTGDPQSKDFGAKALKLKTLINEAWWVEEDNSYADFISSREKAIALTQAALIRADTLKKRWAVKELTKKLKRLKSSGASRYRGYTIFHNAVVNSPMEAGIAESDKARRALLTARTYRNYFGAYVTGIDKSDDDVDSPIEKSRKKVFNYTGAVMTLPTGLLAIAEARYGNPDEAMDYLSRLGRTFSYALPGSMYEVSPDFGMMTQAWNVYAVVTPVVNHFFGIDPMAGEKTVIFRPSFPKGWEEAAISNLPVGDNSISFRMTSSGYVLEQSKPEWKLLLQVGREEMKINGRAVKAERAGEQWMMVLTGERKFTVE